MQITNNLIPQTTLNSGTAKAGSIQATFSSVLDKEFSQRMDTLYSTAFKLNGLNVSGDVWWSDNSTTDNLMMLVKGINTNGMPFESEVSIFGIDPKNASPLEMIALNGYYSTKGTPLLPMLSLDGSYSQWDSNSDIFSKIDYLSLFQDMLGSSQNNAQKFAELKQTLYSLMNIPTGV